MALIDHHLPVAHFSERHATRVMARPEIVLAAARRFRAEDDALFRYAIGLREAPMRLAARFGGTGGTRRPIFGLGDFTLLEESGSEIVRGLAGRFWRADFGLVPIENGEAFGRLGEAGIAKFALAFAVRPLADGATELSTETRVFCTDEGARRRFRPYWYLIRPVSGWIRRRALASIRQASEASVTFEGSAAEEA